MTVAVTTVIFSVAGLGRFDGELRRAEMGEKARIRWTAAMGEAETNLQIANKIPVLSDQIERFQQAQAIRNFCQAAELETAKLDPDARNEAHDWIAWATARADAIDPLRQRLSIPPDRRFSASDLAPYLPDGLVPWGPPG